MSKLSPEQEDAIVSSYKELNSCQKVSAATGHSKNTVHRVVKKHGVRCSQNKFTPEQELEIITLYQGGMSLLQLQEHFNCTNWHTFRNILKRHGVERRKRGNQLMEMTPEQQELIVLRWRSGESKHAICQELGIAYSTMSRWLKQIGIKMENRGATGEKHGNWKGGRLPCGNYISVWVHAEDPMRVMANNMGYVMEHRLVMAQHLGRFLEKYETVHHINGNEHDNRLENLQLRIGRHGAGQCFRCRNCGSCDVEPVEI